MIIVYVSLYQLPMRLSIICQPVNIFKYLSETIGPIELKFHIELLRVTPFNTLQVCYIHIEDVHEEV